MKMIPNMISPHELMFAWWHQELHMIDPFYLGWVEWWYFFPPQVLSQKQTKHQKNNPLGGRYQETSTFGGFPPISGIEHSSGQAFKGTFFIDLSLWNSKMLEDFTVFLAWFGKKKVDNSPTRDEHLVYTIKNTFHMLSSFWKRRYELSFPHAFLVFL